MAKDLKLTFLLDFYGPLLTGSQREMVEAYYNEDLSLAEIAEERGITRQGVRDAVKRAQQELEEMESKLGLAHRFLEMRKALENICDCALAVLGQCGPENEDIVENCEKILELAGEIAENE